MNLLQRLVYCILIFCSVLLMSVDNVRSQSVLYDYGQHSWMQLEINKPLLDQAGIDFFSLTNYLSGQVSIDERWALQADLPLYTLDLGSDVSEDMFKVESGNLGLGTSYRDTSGRFLAELMIRLPTSSREYIPPEFHTDMERVGTTSLVEYSVRLLGNYIHRVEEGFTYRFRGGLNAVWPKDDDLEEELDMEWIFQLAGMAGIASPKADFQLGLATATIISEEGIDFSDRLRMYLQAIVEIGDGPIRPFTLLRVPLEEDEIFSTSLGIGCTIVIE